MRITTNFNIYKGMNELVKFLVDGIITEAIETTIVVYSGRFQPFHRGHYATYKGLVAKFGKDNVYIATSNKTDNKKSPFNFKEKKLIIQKMFGIPSDKIVQVRNPYAPMEILANYPEETTGFITAVGEKDEMRLSGKYFKKYKGKVEGGYKDIGYVYISPTLPNAISGTEVRNMLSKGTEEEKRKNFLKAYPKFDERVYKLITLKLGSLSENKQQPQPKGLGFDDDTVPSPWLNQPKSPNVPYSSALGGLAKAQDKDSNIGNSQKEMEKDWLKKHAQIKGPTKPFKEDKINETTLGGYMADEGEPATMYIPDGTKRILDKGKPEPWFKQLGFTQTQKPKADYMRGKGKEKDKESSFRKVYYKVTNFNPSDLKPAEKPKGVKAWKPIKEDAIKGGLAKGLSLNDIAKKHGVTVDIMVAEFKKGIKVEMEHTTNREIAKEIALDHLYEDPKYYTKLAGIEKKESVNESLLLEGGAYGHMNHPFDVQMNLTFGDLKNIVKKALTGKLELAREKTDGQALAVSWVNGRLVAARNKSHLKNQGAGAMSVQDVISKFAGRGSVSDAFSFAIKDLESAIKGLSDKDKKSIFKDGKCFMNCEIIYPENTNVIPYGQSLLVFHGTMEYNNAGDAIGENPTAGAKLAAMVKKVNADVQSKFKLQGPPIQKLPVNKDLKAKQSIFLSKIQALQSEFGLGDKNGVADYHQAWWKQFIEKNTTGLDEQQKIGLVKRWAFGDKGFRIKDIKDDKNREWAEKIEKQDQQKITKENLLKFEAIFLGVGAEVLSFMTSVLTVNPDAAKQQLLNRLETAINSIKATGDAKNVEKLNTELARIEALGGFDKIVPNEGIVFSYKGNTFKLTGAFAPLNQILGIFTFGR